MKIDSAVRVFIHDLVDAPPPEFIKLHYGSEGAMGALIGVSWKYNTGDATLNQIVKKHGGFWQSPNGWGFKDDDKLTAFLDLLRRRHADWPVMGDVTAGSLKSVKFERLNMPDDEDACLLVSLPLPFQFQTAVQRQLQVSKLTSGRQSVGVLRGNTAAVDEFVQCLATGGAVTSGKLVQKWGVSTNPRPLIVTSEGWSVQIECDLSNLDHLLLAPDQKYRWDAPYQMGTKKTPILWLGSIKTTRKKWTEWRAKIEALGLTWSGDDPAVSVAIPSSIRTEQILGWSQPAPNGHLLHEYQKKGVLFCASRGMHALIGDEMGIGKTAQAIGAAQAVEARQIFVICPKSARYVWDREIKGWCGPQAKIQHIRNQTDLVSSIDRWHILTYDQLVSKRETWTFQDSAEEESVLKACPALKDGIVRNAKKKTSKVAIADVISIEPNLGPERLARWRKMMLRMQGPLLAQILDGGPVTLIVDEAHRAKNVNSKRSQAIAKIAEHHRETNVLLLTGTPLRNNEHEAAVLLSYLDPDAKNVLSKVNGYSIQDVKDYLGYFMIRRTKSEVLPELPEKTRQRVDLDALATDNMDFYTAALEDAVGAYLKAISSGRSEADARNQMRGGIEKARTALGMAKVSGGQVADLVADVVEDKGCCVVFCAHHDVSDKLQAQLQAMGVKANVVDGRSSAQARAETEAAFQAGELDVFIGGINSAGEAITLTRADTVIFVELDWVPAALLQAEDRIHRVGQKASCLVLHLIAKFDDPWSSLHNLDESLIDIIGAKMDRIGSVLDEDQSNLISNGARNEITTQLIRKYKGAVPSTPAAIGPSPVQAFVVDSDSTPAAKLDVELKPEVVKRKRGRPKVYVDREPLNASARSKQSVEALKQRGGKRLMLRLSPEGLEALKAIMFVSGLEQETESINKTLVAHAEYLKSMHS
jgi:superfamily II DNA or RNA helicase